MNRKNIVILYSGSRNWGGIDSYLLNLFKHYDRSKADLTLVSLGNWAVVREIEKHGGKIKVFSGKRFNPLTIFKVAGYLRKEGVGLIVSGGLVADSYSRAASLFSSVPHLSIVHSEFRYDYPNVAVRLIYSFLLFISRWKTKSYIAVSEYLKKNLIRSGINEKRITVVYNGVEFNKETERKDKYNDQIVISSIGRLHKVKGYENLVKAVPLIKEGDWVIKIYGEGGEKDKLESLINKLGVTDKIKLCGHINNINDVLSESDIYIQPSISEGFGLTVVEAMGAGLAVIVTPVGSLPEIVKDGINGVITKGTDPGSLAKELNAIIFDNKKAHNLGFLASEDVRKRFGVNLWADKTVDTFMETIK